MSLLNTSQGNITSPCHPLLFRLGDLSFEPNISSNTTICPDSIFTPIISSIFSFLCLVMIVFSVPMMIIKRKSGHLINRNILFMAVDLIINSYFILNTGLRYMVGRRTFPCLVYSITFFVIPPSIFLPNILKCWRLFSLNKINGIISNTLNETSHSSSNRVSIERQQTDKLATEKAYQEDLKQLPTKQKRLLSFLRFTTSNSFSLFFYIAVIIFHIVFWLICGGIDLATQGRKYFLMSGTLLDPESGCILGTGSILIVAAQCVVYLVFELIVLGLCFYSDRDTWKIKKETIICAFFQLLSCILFAVLGNIDIVKYLVDNLVPYGNVIVAYSTFAIFVSVVLPIFYSIKDDMKKNQDLERNIVDDVEKFLSTKEHYEKLLDFARRSYCPENLLCWNMIQAYKKSFQSHRNAEEPIRIGTKIVESYLKPSSLAQINLPSELINTVSEIEVKLSNPNEPLSPTLFDSIQNHCLLDIQCDVYSRFIVSGGKVNSITSDIPQSPINNTL